MLHCCVVLLFILLNKDIYYYYSVYCAYDVHNEIHGNLHTNYFLPRMGTLPYTNDVTHPSDISR